MSKTAIQIDWRRVLGPLLENSIADSELSGLTSAIFELSARAVRPRPGLELAALPFATEPVPWYANGRLVAEEQGSVRPGSFLQYAAGDYYIQDAGSMLALALCEIQPGHFVCDTCASPGGKASAILESLCGSGMLLANETIGSRHAILELALARTGMANFVTTNLEVEPLSALCGPGFDRILVDAPCTGQTLVGKGKQSLAAFSSTQIEHSAARQQRILNAAAGLAKVGGQLVYSTCAFSYTENEGVVTAFLDSHPNWRCRSAPHLAEYESPLNLGCYRVWPHRHPSAGAFAALLEKVDEAPLATASAADRSFAERRRSSGAEWSQLRSQPAGCEWVRESSPGQWWLVRDKVHRFDAEIPSDWICRSRAAVAVAELKVGRWQPLYGSSVCNALSSVAEIDLDDSEVAQFVAGQVVPKSAKSPDAAAEWLVARWRGRRLAWGKLAAGQLKNHFPKALRQSGLV